MEENIQSTETQQVENQEQVAPDGQKFFSQEDVELMITKRLAREKTRMEKEAEKQRKLAEMSAEERLRADMEEQRRELAEFKAKSMKAELNIKATEQLRSYGVDTSLAPFLIGSDEEETIVNVRKFKTVWDMAIKSATDRALAGTTPSKPNVIPTDEETDPLLKAFNKTGW